MRLYFYKTVINKFLGNGYWKIFILLLKLKLEGVNF